MPDEKDASPSDVEKSNPKPRDPKDREPPTTPSDDQDAEKDPSEQPS